MASYRKEEHTQTWTVYYSYRDPSGTLHRTCKREFPRKKDARVWYEEWERRTRGRLTMTVNSLITIYLSDIRPRVKATTWETKQMILRTKIQPYFGQMPVGEVTSLQVREWQQQLLEAGYAPTYLRTIHVQCSTLFQWAVTYLGLPSNPARTAGAIGTASRPKQNMVLWSPEQFARFSEETRGRPVTDMAFQVLFWTGIRLGECLALTLADVDLTHHRLTINKSLQRIHSEDIVTPPKTEKSIREISLPRSLEYELMTYLQEQFPNGKDLPPETRLFPCSKYQLEYEFSRAAREAGLPKARVHDLRHSHASLLIRMGATPVQVAARLGHENPSTTLNVYSHLWPDEQDQLADLLETEFRGPNTK